MIRAMDLAQMGPGQVRIKLGGGNITMPQHLLYCPQIRAPFEQVGGEAMPQCMRADPGQPLIARRPSLECLEEALTCHRAPQTSDKGSRVRADLGCVGVAT